MSDGIPTINVSSTTKHSEPEVIKLKTEHYTLRRVTFSRRFGGLAHRYGGNVTEGEKRIMMPVLQIALRDRILTNRGERRMARFFYRGLKASPHAILWRSLDGGGGRKTLEACVETVENRLCNTQSLSRGGSTDK